LKIVYLDQLHWIEIAKCVNGKPAKDGTSEALEHMNILSNSGCAVFPLSISHYYETLKHSDPNRRQRLASVMRTLSQGFSVAALRNIVRHEVRSALVSILDLNNKKEEFQYLGKGFEHALGRYFNLKLVWPKPEHIPEYIRNKFENDIFSIIEATFLSGVLKSGEIEYLFTKVDLTSDNKFKDHLEEWKGCASTMTEAELKRRIYSITFKDILEPISEELVYLGVPLEKFMLLGEESFCRFLNMMPTRKVDMHLREQWARNGSLTPKQSDLNDWCYIGSAVCYSDFVITENQITDLLSRSQIYAPKVTSKLSDILNFNIA